MHVDVEQHPFKKPDSDCRNLPERTILGLSSGCPGRISSFLTWLCSTPQFWCNCSTLLHYVAKMPNQGVTWKSNSLPIAWHCPLTLYSVLLLAETVCRQHRASKFQFQFKEILLSILGSLQRDWKSGAVPQIVEKCHNLCSPMTNANQLFIGWISRPVFHMLWIYSIWPSWTPP